MGLTMDTDTAPAPLSMRIQPHPGRREQLVERLRLAIATGHFKPGARLIERELYVGEFLERSLQVRFDFTMRRFRFFV